ncbi:MAG: acyl-CoA dehydrogenase family protein [Gammaproteobacteria bacterium]|nr:acyl-CoA dehydrogenase family protein [Gammaproteobacteria bacterium]MDH3371922.1 acyl-CoA dehydrogenase family protein [Gammaproteobacteria bacterium]MDH3407749.1 acyl-CoA dehydrogenase family protein [Gammaproteobacteria bacterium]MDH3551132.1 acyl-CoA dehydrogenase family protein [Gammaproteobacteria bacterium]
MDFTFTTDELELRDGAREYLRGRCTPETLRGLVESGTADLAGWPELVEMGFAGFLVPDSAGGLGMSDTAFVLLAEEAGYVAMPEPLVDVAGIAAPLLAALDSDAAAQIAAGAIRVLTSHPLNPYVNQLGTGDQVLRFSDDKVELIAAADIETTTVDSIDPLRQLAHIETAETAILAEGVEAGTLAARAALRGALFTAGELLGLTAAMIDMSRAYAVERKQFGVAIGTFQAVKHHLATAFTRLEFARPVVYRAAATLDGDERRARLAVAHAKIAAADAATGAAEAAIQVHGGIGYTFEADLHLFMKRVWALCGLWGDRHHHMRFVDSEILHGHLQTGPATTFAANGLASGQH